MVIRLLGALLIAGASLSLGLIYICGEIRKINTLRSMLQLLKEIRGELEARISPLPELISLMAGRCTGAGGDFALLLNSRMTELGERSFPQLWEESVEESLGLLQVSDKETIRMLGYSLGRFELERQLAELDICINSIENSISLYSSCLPEKKRMGLGIPCSLGALLLIVLI